MTFKSLKSVFSLISEKRLTTVAGAWVYFFLTALIPLVFLLVTAFGVFGVNIGYELVSRLPEEFRIAGETIVETAENASKGITLFLIITVIFSCSTLLNQMSKDGDFIYGKTSSVKRGLLRRLWAVACLAMLYVVFLSVAFVFAFGTMLFATVSVGGFTGVLYTALFFLSLILFGYAIILLLNRFICPYKTKFKNLALGSFLSLFIIVLGTIFFTLYLRFSGAYNAFYGTLSGIVVFLIWAYILMLGLVVGAIVNAESVKKSA